MARPLKKGLDYFPFDVGFWSDSSIRILKSRYHADGIALYVHILCDIYREGYYLSVKSYEDYLCVLADDLGLTFDKVEQILTFICKRSLLVCFRTETASKGLQEDAVFTSHGIQKRYIEALKSRKKSVAEIKGEYWLLSDSEEAELDAFYKCTKNEGFSEINPSFSEINPSFSEINPINKIKRNKSNNPPISPKGTGGGDREEFFKTYPRLSLGGLNDEGIDYSVLLDRFARSARLRDTYSMKWVIENYEGICGGLFRDVEAPADLRAERERWYSIRRSRAEEIAEQTKKKAEQIPGFMEIETELRKIDIEEAKAEVDGDETRLNQIRERKGILQDQRKLCLMRAGMTEEDLLPKYHCPKCSDTGFLPDGKPCDCYEKEKK